MKKTLIACLVLLAIGVSAQPDQETVYLKKSRHIEIDFTGNELNVVQTDQFDKAFNKNFEKHTYHSIYYSDFDPVIKLEAETQTSVKGKMKRVKVSTVETKDMVTPGIFYGGYKKKEFVFPAVSTGSVGHLETVQEIKDIHLITPFYFTDIIPVNQSVFSVSFPKNVVIQYRLFGPNKEAIDFKKTESSNKVKYEWAIKDVAPYRFESNSPSRSYSAPHIVMFVDSYRVNGNVINVLPNVSGLYNWYSGLINRMPAGGDYTELDSKIIELTKNVGLQRDKVKAIFQWVQQNIKYIAFEDGMAGFIPRAANDVYLKRFGDCKDMANLLFYMITKAGGKAYLTWIGTRDRPYRYEELPTPIVDNHMICAVQENGQYYFLDATNPFLEFAKPSSMIQGKEALIGLNKNEYKVELVPIAERVSNLRIDSVALQVATTGVQGTFSGRLFGYKRDDWQTARLKAELNNDNEYLRDFFKLGDNNIAIDSAREEMAGTSDKVSFKFFQPGYYSKVGDRLFINLNFSNSISVDEIQQTRETPVENDYRYEDRLVVTFEIPNGFTVKSLPSPSEKTWDDFGVTTNYRLDGSAIVLERTIYCDYLYLQKTGFEKWNEFLRALGSINNQVVTLSKTK